MNRRRWAVGAWLALVLVSGQAWTGSCAAARAADTRVRDLEGRAFDPLAHASAPALVLLFTDPQCPISNAFAPEVQRLQAEFAPRGVEFTLVYADPERTAEEVRRHVHDFGYPFPAVLDPAQELARRAGATLVPEACVFAHGELVYRGRIDDRYVAFGKQRAAPTTRDLHAALTAVLAGARPAEPWPSAIGCSIPPPLPER
ncbi:MAG: redoxin domain-containing protein [Planctomycetes bacterium]|nr:redoxin domain-containing protein [Planctomycetota bacterium]